LQIDGMNDAAFAMELESKAGAVDADMTVTHGGETEGIVFLGVFLVADANKRHFQQTQYGGKDLLSGKAFSSEVFLHTLSDQWKRAPECDHPFKFVSVPHFAPSWMVPVLFTAPGIPARRL
jgi:hypothetical protein